MLVRSAWPSVRVWGSQGEGRSPAPRKWPAEDERQRCPTDGLLAGGRYQGWECFDDVRKRSMSTPTQQSAPVSRNARLTVRFAPAELARVGRRARALGLSPSAYVRGLVGEATRPGTSKETAAPTDEVSAVTVPAMAPRQLAAVHAARVDVKRETVNLNQLVRLAHRGDLDLGRLEPVIARLVESNDRVVGLLTEGSWP